jgi:glucokinase
MLDGDSPPVPEGRDRLLLAGDVGGTKVDLAVVSVEAGPRQPLAKRRYASTAYASLAEMARAFLGEVGMEVDAACLDVAGPVIGGQAQLTNLPWDMSEASLAAALDVDKVWLLNDLVATASAIPLLGPDELHPVKEGEPVPGGTIAVLAPGTGLGEAFLTQEADGYRAHASEGGHAAFAPTDELELELLRNLLQRFDHVSFERVASGVGIPNLYDFLRDRVGGGESSRLADELNKTTDRTRPILEAALDPVQPDPLASATLVLFLQILGTEAANLALKMLATGGVYLAGGIAQVLRDALRSSPFHHAFTRAGRFSPMLERVPVMVVMGEVALLGAASEGLRLLAGPPVA